MPEREQEYPFSEAHFRLAMETAHVGMWDRDLLGKRHTWSDECKAIFGLSPTAEIDYALFLRIVAPDDRERVDRLVRESLQQKTDYRVTYRVIWPNGSLHWIEARGRGIYDRQGNAIRMMGVVFDITAQKQAEEIQQEADRQIRNILNSVMEAFSHVDREWRTTYINEQLERIAKVPREEVLGRVVWDAYPVLVGSVVEQTLRQVMETRQPGHCEFYDTHLQQWAEFHVYPADDGGITIFSTNVTARYELERKKDDFLSMASHELRTPLTSIKGNLQLVEHRLQRLLESDELSFCREGKASVARVACWVKSALRQVNTESRLMNDLLDAIQVRNDQLHVSLEPCNLVELVTDVVNDMRPLAGSHPLHLDIPQKSTILVLADAVRIRQVVMNYLTNALRYSTEAQPIVVGLSCEDHMTRVWVKDWGPGLSPDIQQRIWDRFSQVARYPGQKGPFGEGGLGLGLYISRALIQQHRGQVGVESVSGEGATFWFTLPLLQVE